MADVLIHDLQDPIDLLLLARHLLDLLATGDLSEILGSGTLHLTKGDPAVPSDDELIDLVRPHEVYTCDVPHHRNGCSCRADAASTDPRQFRVLEAERHEGPVPYIHCSTVGTHGQLTECWMCWSDVHRGALVLAQVLAA